MARYDYLIFDLDGVIIKSMGPWLSALETANLEYKMAVDSAQTRLILPNLSKAVEFGLPKDQLDAYCRRIESLANPGIEAAPLYEHVPELLHDLKDHGRCLSIFSSNWNVGDVLTGKGINHFFEPCIVSGRDVTKHKPDPEGIEKALGLMRGEKSKAVMIGDSASDIQAANNAGIDSVLFYPKSHSKFHDIAALLSHRPSHIVGSHVELGRILLRTGNGHLSRTRA